MTINIFAPHLDELINACQANPEIKDKTSINKLLLVFDLMGKLEIQGDDELRSIWLTTKRGKIDDFGDYFEYSEKRLVNNEEDFKDLWNAYYPEKIKWYNFSVTKYAETIYYYIDSKLIFRFKVDEIDESCHDFQSELTNWILQESMQTISLILLNINDYNNYINANLPYAKRIGRILRNDFWAISPEAAQDLKSYITDEIIHNLEKIKYQSTNKKFKQLSRITAGDFYRFCEIGYDANGYFEGSENSMKPKEKYLKMADGRDCGLKNIDENSTEEFLKWYQNEKNCGGHPWEICSGGNSTHISLFVFPDENGWYLRLEGSSRARVIETIKMAIALYDHKIPFILSKAEEIIKMAKGVDYIGIVPENVFPRYCRNLFPDEDGIIDFMNLGYEKTSEIITKAHWYPLERVNLLSNSYESMDKQ